MPDEDFSRPYLAVPGGHAFVWPLGVEGFDIITSTTLGLHKYLGEIELDVSVTHRGEKRITLSGVLPGWTSNENMVNLQGIYEADTPENGKILYLPGIFQRLQYVVGESANFKHNPEDRTQDINYSIVFIKVGLGKKIKQRSNHPPPGRKQNKGKAQRYFVANNRYHTLRQIARKLWHNANRWTELYNKNPKWFNNHQPPIPTHQIPDYRIPNGVRIRY
jgi:hypothetical protein